MKKPNNNGIKLDIEAFQVVDFLNQARENSWDTECDMYTNGSFLIMDIDKIKARDELVKLLDDIEIYQMAEEKQYEHGDNPNHLGMSVLVDYVESKCKCKILYDRYKPEGQEFYAEYH